jgi:hypothetical protein
LTALLAGGPVLAASQEIGGVWRGTLQINPKTAMTIDFAFVRRPDGQYTATLNSPTSGAIKNVAAKAVSLQDDALKVEVPALSGTFSGTVKAGSIDGKWAQPGSSFPLVLNPKPPMPRADIDTIVGTWSGALKPPPGGTFVMRFKMSDQGDLTGTMAIASNQGNGEWPMAEAEFANGKLFFKMPPLGGEFAASYADGALNGMWKQAGALPGGVPVTLKKGDASAATFRVLKLSGEAFVALSGRWGGTLKMKNAQGQDVSQSIAMQFSTDSNAQIVGFINSPAQSGKAMPISEASLDGGKLVAKLEAIGAEYRGELTGNTLRGEWVQGSQRVPLTLSR